MRRVTLSLPSGSSSAVLLNGRGRVLAASARETTGSAEAIIRFTDGNSSDARLILPYSLAASESARDWYGDHGIPFEIGLYLDVVSGTAEASITIILEDEYEHWMGTIKLLEDLARMARP